MPLESMICRRKLDSEYGNEWLCQCFRCRDERKEIEKEHLEDKCPADKPLDPGESLGMAGEDISSLGASRDAVRDR